MARFIPWTMLALALAALIGLALQNQRLSSQLAALDGRLAALAAPREPPSCGSLAVDASFARQVADEVLRRQQLAGAAALPAPEGSAEIAADPAARSEPNPHPDHAEALVGASDVLDQALERGRLTRDDVLTMRAQVAEVGGGAALDPLRSRIAQLINAQKLAIEDPRFVYP
jgi:hypothetical protein